MYYFHIQMYIFDVDEVAIKTFQSCNKNEVARTTYSSKSKRSKIQEVHCTSVKCQPHATT